MLFHHDPHRTDDELDAIVARLRDAHGEQIEVLAAREDLVLTALVLPVGDLAVGVVDRDVGLELREVREDQLAERALVRITHGIHLDRASTTHAGSAWPCTSTVMRMRVCTPGPASVTSTSSPPPRRREPTGTPLGKRTASVP